MNTNLLKAIATLKHPDSMMHERICQACDPLLQGDWSREDFIQSIRENYGDIAVFAMITADHIAQVDNGGYHQYFTNGYVRDVPELLRLAEEFGFGNNPVIQIIRSLDLEMDHDADDNISLLDDLDDRYFPLSEAWSLNLESFFVQKIQEC